LTSASAVVGRSSITVASGGSESGAQLSGERPAYSCYQISSPVLERGQPSAPYRTSGLRCVSAGHVGSGPGQRPGTCHKYETCCPPSRGRLWARANGGAGVAPLGRNRASGLRKRNRPEGRPGSSSWASAVFDRSTARGLLADQRAELPVLLLDFDQQLLDRRGVDLDIQINQTGGPRRAARGDQSSEKRSAVSLFCESIEQCLRLLQNRRVEPLRETAVDLRQQLASLIPLPSVAPQTDKMNGGIKLPVFGLLLARYTNCRLILIAR
jgi:hypothetical protein